MSYFKNNTNNKENSTEQDNIFENITDDLSRVMERKEKREYLQHNKTQFRFFSGETKRLREEIRNTEDSSEIESLRKELDYTVFRRSQESLFEDYLSDDFDEEMFNDELEGVRKNELKYLKKQFSRSENENDVDMGNFYNMITQEVSRPEGINENDSRFREKINPFIDQLVAKKGGPNDWTHLELEDKIIGAKKYNKDSYLEKFRGDLEMSKTISRITKQNSEFMSNLDNDINQSSKDYETWNKYYEKFGEDFGDDSFELKKMSLIPWITRSEDGFPADTAKGLLSSESYLYTDLINGTEKYYLNKLKEFEVQLGQFNKKYNVDTFHLIENKAKVSEFATENQSQEQASSASNLTHEEEKASRQWETITIPNIEKKSEYTGITDEEIEESRKFMETINVSGSKEKKEGELEIPAFDDYDKRAEFYRENIKDLAESKFDLFKETISPTIENSMKEFILESIKFDINSKNNNERMNGKTFPGNINSLGIGIGFYIQRLIALKSGKVLDIVDIQKLSIRQVARDYLNITEFPEGFSETYSDRIPDREI